MELSLAPSLGTLIAKHGTAIPETLGPLRQQAMLYGSTDNRGRTLWPQGAAAVPTIKKGVHLLSHHIGGLTDAAGEQLRHL